MPVNCRMKRTTAQKSTERKWACPCPINDRLTSTSTAELPSALTAAIPASAVTGHGEADESNRARSHAVEMAHIPMPAMKVFTRCPNRRKHAKRTKSAHSSA